MLLEIAGNVVEAIAKYQNTLGHIEINRTIRTRTGNEYHSPKDNDRSANVVPKRGGIIRILLLLLEVRIHGIVGSRDNIPPERAG